MELDPVHSLSTAGYSFDAILSFTDVNLKLMSDIEKFQFTETTIRDGISLICKGYAEVCNKLLKSIDTNKPTLYIIYLSTINLCGTSMMQLLLAERIGWVNPKDFNLDNCFSDSPIVYSVEIALDYPNERHDLHYDNLLAHAKVKVTEEILSEFQLQIIEDNSFSLSKNENLISNLNNKTKYKLRYQNLRISSILGLQLKEIQRILEFKQETILKSYTEPNTELRREAEKEGNKKQNGNLRSNTILVNRKRIQ